MAKNILYPGPGVSLKLAVPAGVVSGDPVIIGTPTFHVLNGVVITDRDSNGEATVKLPVMFVADLPVYGQDDEGDAAVEIGNTVWIDFTTLQLSLTGDGSYGIALEAVASGQTETILVAVIVGLAMM
ncbi:MAG: hypothetical protein DRJ03_08885 [Chloroflexi bacterium]|nr:MAG: hypothetical protein DRJ03_08885 [Chloroflexota bacterium]